MKLHHLLEEITDEDYDEDRQHRLAEYIVHNCQPYLKEIHHKPDNKLYRGMWQNTMKTENIFRPDKDRQPRDTARPLHRLIGEIFEENFGYNFRGDAVFATGDYAEANNYAESHDNIAVIFPVGNFEYIWSDSVKDLTRNYGQFFKHWKYEDNKNRDVTVQQGYEAYAEYFKDHLLKTYYHNTDLLEGINHLSEIMIKCKSYVAIPKTVEDHKGQRRLLTFYNDFCAKFLLPLL